MVISIVRLRAWWDALVGPAAPPAAPLPRAPDIGWCRGCGGPRITGGSACGNCGSTTTVIADH
jgi:hypothetical protein